VVAEQKKKKAPTDVSASLAQKTATQEKDAVFWLGDRAACA
jgi:hypothetical protein